jgi:cytochrome bd ubiquinol oxidase subunit I
MPFFVDFCRSGIALKIRKTLTVLIPITLGASFSAFFITTVNSFKNTSQGFDSVNGQLVNDNPVRLLFH